MPAKTLLEQRAIFLQKLSYEILTTENLRLATVANLVGDPTIFDKDLSSVISILFAHDNLSSDKVSTAEQPIKLLEQIYKDLEARGFRLPNFKRRYEWIKNTTGGSFRNNKQDAGGGEARALDRPLRRLHESFYELRMHDAGHATDLQNRVVTKHTGAELTGLVDNLIASIKKLETAGKAYNIGSDSDRAGKGRNEFLDQRYDEIAALINTSAGTSAEGPLLTLYHVHSTNIEGERWYVVSERDIPALNRAVLSARPDWDMNKNLKWEHLDTILHFTPEYRVKVVLPEGAGVSGIDPRAEDALRSLRKEYEDMTIEQEGTKVKFTSSIKSEVEQAALFLETYHGGTAGLIRGSESGTQYEKERKLLEPLARPGKSGRPIVRLVRLPFAPDQIDDAFPSVELKEDEYVGTHLSKITLELIRRSRFSGFVEFDDKYRMMILWANAPSDDQKDAEGSTFRDHLVDILKDHKNNFADILGQAPEVLKTKTGAAFYFPRPASIPRIVKNRAALEKAIDAVNGDVEAMEQHTRIERSFNRRIDDDELPLALEEVG